MWFERRLPVTRWAAAHPHLLVCNTDHSNEYGRHSVAICVRDGHGEFFDSFGRAANAIFGCYLNRHWVY